MKEVTAMHEMGMLKSYRDAQITKDHGVRCAVNKPLEFPLHHHDYYELEIDSRVGSLEVGKDADVVIWTADPITSVGAEAFVTIVDGKIAYQK